MSPPNIDFADVFLLDLTSRLPGHTGINNRAIKLVNVNEFMRLSKSPAGAPIFFDRKLDGSLWLSVNYRGLKILQPRTGTVVFDQGSTLLIEVSIPTGRSFFLGVR